MNNWKLQLKCLIGTSSSFIFISKLKIFVIQHKQLFADVVWRPPPYRHIRFKARGALVPVVPPSNVALIYSDEDKQRTLTVDLSSEENYYSLKADQRPTTLSVAIGTPHKGFRWVVFFRFLGYWSFICFWRLYIILK